VITNPFSKKALEESGGVTVEIIAPPLQPFKKPSVPPQVYNPRSPEI
ncbi:MAG: hypothetical protein IIB62_12845, partial [Proteobacteria bacterium]|nr:hypothetical protein [Pseudomonadota bacterium]